MDRLMVVVKMITIYYQFFSLLVKYLGDYSSWLSGQKYKYKCFNDVLIISCIYLVNMSSIVVPKH